MSMHFPRGGTQNACTVRAWGRGMSKKAKIMRAYYVHVPLAQISILKRPER